jgi:hypothetical protein
MIVAQYLAYLVTLRKHFDYKNGSISTKTTETRNENSLAVLTYIYTIGFSVDVSSLKRDNMKAKKDTGQCSR